MLSPSQLPYCDGRDPDGLVLVVVGDASLARLVIVGELDVVTAPRLAQFLINLLHAGYRQVDLDLSRLALLAAAGLAVLCEATAGFRKAEGRLRLVAVTPRIRHILIITGLDAVLDV